MRSLSSRAASRALAAAVVGAARWVNSRYEQYLERSFPRFYILHSTFKTGEPPGEGPETWGLEEEGQKMGLEDGGGAPKRDNSGVGVEGGV